MATEQPSPWGEIEVREITVGDLFEVFEAGKDGGRAFMGALLSRAVYRDGKPLWPAAADLEREPAGRWRALNALLEQARSANGLGGDDAGE